jgi:hypothetical protein
MLVYVGTTDSVSKGGALSFVCLCFDCSTCCLFRRLCSVFCLRVCCYCPCPPLLPHPTLLTTEIQF